MHLKKFFCLSSILTNNDIISAQGPGLKTGVEKGIFWSETGSEFREPGCKAPPKTPRSTPSTSGTHPRVTHLHFQAKTAEDYANSTLNIL